MRNVLRIVLVLTLVGAGGWYYVVQSRPAALVLTGIVTTNDVVVAPQIGGRLVALDVKEGDSVTAGQVLAEIDTGELAADRDYYAHSAESLESSVREQEAGLRLQRKQLQEQEAQAEASIATTIASHAAAAADAERAKVTFERTRDLAASGLAPAQQLDEARTSYTAAQARVRVTGPAGRSAARRAGAGPRQRRADRDAPEPGAGLAGAAGGGRRTATQGNGAARVRAARRAGGRRRGRDAGTHR
jgi:HlyD family secretion protein